MAKVLKVSPQELKNAANAFQTSGTEIKNLTTKMTDLVNSLSGQVFEGEAATAYKNKFNGLQDDINAIHKKITEHVNDLTNIEAAFTAATAAATAAAAKLTTDVLTGI